MEIYSYNKHFCIKKLVYSTKYSMGLYPWMWLDYWLNKHLLAEAYFFVYSSYVQERLCHCLRDVGGSVIGFSHDSSLSGWHSVTSVSSWVSLVVKTSLYVHVEVLYNRSPDSVLKQDLSSFSAIVLTLGWQRSSWSFCL